MRAEDILLGTGAAGALSARNAIPCVVDALEPFPAGVRVLLGGALPLVALVTRAACDELGLAPGREVIAYVKSVAVHVVEVP